MYNEKFSMMDAIMEDVMGLVDGYGKIHFIYTPIQLKAMQIAARKWERANDCHGEQILQKIASSMKKLLLARKANGENIYAEC